MIRGLNKVYLIGVIAANPVIYQAEDGKEYSAILIETSTIIKKSSGVVCRENIVRVPLYSKLCELAKNTIKKGDIVYVDARIITVKKFDDLSQKNIFYLDMFVNELQILKNYKEENINSNDENIGNLKELTTGFIYEDEKYT